MANLDTELRTLLLQKEFFEQNPSAGKLLIGADEPLYISVKFTGDIAVLERAGFKVGSIFVDIAYGETNLAGLEALARHPQVESIEKQRRHRLHLDDSVPDIKANQVWSRFGDNFTGYTGKDVIVGIIDTGIDFRHQAFRKPDGTTRIHKTRIHKIWDQTLTAQGGETKPGPINDPTISPTPNPLGYGVEYNEEQINAAIQESGPGVRARHKDDNGHGTHVSGIAAGDGSQSGGCHRAYHYIGVATDATLIVVRAWRLSENDSKTSPTKSDVILDAIYYILNEARIVAKPVVINLSLGTFSEGMDGNSSDCLAVDRLLLNNSKGTAIVFAAGNDGDAKFHASTTVPAGPTSILELQPRGEALKRCRPNGFVIREGRPPTGNQGVAAQPSAT
jgi:subtilisin family serine protease